MKYTIGVPEEQRKFLVATKPEIEVTVDGNQYTVVNKVGEKTINVSFKLGEEYEADRGDGETGKVVICSIRRFTMLFVWL